MLPKPSNQNRSNRPAGSDRRVSAHDRAAALREANAARERRRTLLLWGAVGAVVVVIAVAVGLGVANRHSDNTSTTDTSSATLTGPMGPEGIALEQGTVFAPASAAAHGSTVDGIQCNPQEQAVYHIHAHLAIYVDGALRPVPGGVGVVQPVAQQSPNGPFYGASKCYYWLHTHAQDGIIHIEAPSQTTYTLGQFFAIWQQRLSGSQIGPANGTVTAYVNGKAYAGDPSAIPLTSREDIQLVVGSPTVAPKRVDWSKSQL